MIILPNGACAEGAEHKKLKQIYKEVKEIKLDDIATNIEKKPGYAQCVYTGVLKPEHRDIDLLKLAIICDDGYWFFGGKSYVEEKTGKFEVTIWTD